MTEPANGNTETRRSSSATFCTWEIPDSSVKIDLHLSTVEWVDFEMKKALRFPAHGGEVSGLLLGRTESGSPRKIIIEGFTSLPREHEPGIAYRFSGSDKPILKVQIDQWQPGLGKNLYAVGYYRSDRLGDFGLDELDAAVGKEYFFCSTSVFLVVKPSLTENSTGAFFLCENGELKPDSRIIFPFNRQSLGVDPASSFWDEEELPTADDASSPDHSWPDPFDAVPRPSWFIEKSGWAQRFRWPLLAALGLMILVIAGTAYHISRQPEGRAARGIAQKTDNLALKVEIEKNQIRIGWDRNSPVIAAARRGLLVIQDGASTRNLDLDAFLLRTGSLVYSTVAADVTVRLEVDSAERIASESVRVVRSPYQISWPSGGDARAGAGAEAKRPSELSTAIADANDIAREGGLSRSRSRPGEVDLLRDRNSLPQEAKPGSGSGSEEGRFPMVLARADTAEDSYVGPRPVHRVEPEPSFSLHPFIVPEVQINVRISIDRSGRVVRAESLSRGNALMEHLSKIAVPAARQWTFSPARREGQSVPSEIMLQFQFVNKSLRRTNTTE